MNSKIAMGLLTSFIIMAMFIGQMDIQKFPSAGSGNHIAIKYPKQNQVLNVYGQLPISSKANLGQIDSQMEFVSQGGGNGILFSAKGAGLGLSSVEWQPSSDGRNILANNVRQLEIADNHHYSLSSSLLFESVDDNADEPPECLEYVPSRPYCINLGPARFGSTITINNNLGYIENWIIVYVKPKTDPAGWHFIDRFYPGEGQSTSFTLGLPFPQQMPLDWEGIVEVHSWKPLSATISPPSPLPGGSIEGVVKDGLGQNLQRAKVELLRDESVLDATITGFNGEYEFPTNTNALEPGNYSIKVFLQYDNSNTNTTILRVRYGFPAISVTAETNAFTLAPAETKRVDIIFGNTALRTDNSIPEDRLDDLATIYIHAMETIEYGRTVLGVNHDFNLPIDIFGFRNVDVNGDGEPDTFYQGGDITISVDDSDMGSNNRPMNREWHEMFHELMADTIGTPNRQRGDINHRGFANSSTTDSWIEGWAWFWPTQLAQYLGMSDPHLYRAWGYSVNLEANHQAADNKYLAEEISVASLLWDLVDQVDTNEDDFVDLSVPDLWSVIGNSALTDMKDVYDSLVSNSVGSGDADSDGITDLDEIFVVHGFYVDTNGNGEFDPEEPIGRAANTGVVSVVDERGLPVTLIPRPNRRNVPLIPRGNLLVSVLDEQGQTVGDGTVEVSIEFSEDLAFYNYQYSVDLESLQDGRLPLNPPASRMPATLSIRVITPAGGESDILIINNDVFWRAAVALGTEFVAVHNFDLSKTGTATALTLIDIKPGSDPNSIYCSAVNNVIVVALLTTSSFDATTVDHSTVIFEGASETHVNKKSGEPHRHEEDMDGDGDLDLVFHFRLGDTSLNCDSIQATLNGETFDGLAFVGTDNVNMVIRNSP